MGDRARIKVIENRTVIWFYTHWLGTDLPETLRATLDRNERHDDPAYLNRMIFNAMTKEDPTGSTGFGLSTQEPDNDRKVTLVLNHDAGKVYLTGQFEDHQWKGSLREYTFSEFASLPSPLTWDYLTD